MSDDQHNLDQPQKNEAINPSACSDSDVTDDFSLEKKLQLALECRQQEEEQEAAKPKALSLAQASSPIQSSKAENSKTKTQCIPMTRLRSLASRVSADAISSSEQSHLECCAKCEHRMLAFERLSTNRLDASRAQRPARAAKLMRSASPSDSSSRKPSVGSMPKTSIKGVVRLGLRYTAGLAAALLISIGLVIWNPQINPPANQQASNDSNQMEQDSPFLLGGAPSQVAEAIDIDYLPAVYEDEELRIDQFHLSAQQDCAVLVILRGWDQSCGCIDWTSPGSVISPIHSLAGKLGDATPTVADHSASSPSQKPSNVALPAEIFIRKRLKVGESIEIDMDVTTHPPLEQLLLIVRAPSIDLLPKDLQSTLELIECMEDCRAVEDSTHDALWDQEDTSYYLDAASSCLPTGLKVMGRAFWVQ